MEALKQYIRQQILDAGFTAVGFTNAENLEHAGQNLAKMIGQNFHGEMDWLKTTQKIRSKPTSYFPEAKSIVITAHNYFRDETFFPEIDTGIISIYARGRDYHKVVRNKLKLILKMLMSQYPEMNGRVFVDSFPIMEKPLAVKAGLGWIGKNTTFISQKNGSYQFLGGILLNVELPEDKSFDANYCGKCSRCIDSCPTDALLDNSIMDAGKCISYLTIEHDGNISADLSERMGNYVFGCDICQYVCPWNQKLLPTTETDFFSRFTETDLLLSRLSSLNEIEFKKMFAGTPVLRSGYQKFMRNVKIAQQNAINLRETEISDDTTFCDEEDG